MAVLALVGMAPLGAQGATVSFNTIGHFSTNAFTTGTDNNTHTSVAVSAGGPNNGTLTVDGDVLVFTGSSIVNQALPISGNTTGTSFGTFNFSGAPNDVSFTNVGFALDIFQTSPLPAGGPPQATFVGTVFGNLDFNNGVLTVTFNPPLTRLVGPASGTDIGVVYGVPVSQPINAVQSNASLAGTLAMAPIPSTATAGLVLMGLLGGFGGVKVLRRQFTLA